jgi:hypothetical protein
MSDRNGRRRVAIDEVHRMKRAARRVGIRSLAIGLTVTAASVAPMWTAASSAAAKG